MSKTVSVVVNGHTVSKQTLPKSANVYGHLSMGIELEYVLVEGDVLEIKSEDCSDE